MLMNSSNLMQWLTKVKWRQITQFEKLLKKYTTQIATPMQGSYAMAIDYSKSIHEIQYHISVNPMLKYKAQAHKWYSNIQDVKGTY